MTAFSMRRGADRVLLFEAALDALHVRAVCIPVRGLALSNEAQRTSVQGEQNAIEEASDPHDATRSGACAFTKVSYVIPFFRPSGDATMRSQ